MLVSVKAALLWGFLLVAPFCQGQTVVDVISRDPQDRFWALNNLLTVSRLTNTLDDSGPFTLFAPSK